ncbi:ankyrin repeat and protein kinase domain-containing protein 1-like [Schistocerca piceifrons]|uniref:ankyrin repeat and protein kinase domain-containing protein 1-like n=1 Tax=Schistocerca piceifrons TaxID=274613 RepID=UPI001F5EB8D3|nr:ankyrin repeat and protein kinase domain-containing protein 1-like [Schistocerca piceifrons]
MAKCVSLDNPNVLPEICFHLSSHDRNLYKYLIFSLLVLESGFSIASLKRISLPGGEIWRLPAEQRGRRLILVTEQGAVGDMRALLAVGADVGARGGARGWTVLHVAASSGDVEATRLLVDAGAAVDARITWQQWTPLCVAAERDRAAVARLLLRANADHKARDGSGWTPLHLAARCGNAEVAAALLQAGAERDATTGDSGATAVDLVRENKDSRLMEMLS